MSKLVELPLSLRKFENTSLGRASMQVEGISNFRFTQATFEPSA